MFDIVGKHFQDFNHFDNVVYFCFRAAARSRFRPRDDIPGGFRHMGVYIQLRASPHMWGISAMYGEMLFL